MVGFVVFSGAPGQPFGAHLILTTLSEAGPAGAVAVTVIALAVSAALQPLQYRLVQILEGYWRSRALRPLFVVGVWRQRRRRRRYTRLLTQEVGADAIEGIVTTARVLSPTERFADEQEHLAEQALLERFPAEERLLPTALGNVLRAAEDRSGVRYGIESVLIWPRLYAVLPERHMQTLEDETTQLDQSARLCVTWCLSALVTFAILLADVDDVVAHRAWFAIVAVLAGAGWISYRGATESALALGQDIEVTLDLYRQLVLEAVRFPEPHRLSEERRLFRELCELLACDDEEQEVDIEFRVPG